jgi:hypothetical protein
MRTVGVNVQAAIPPRQSFSGVGGVMVVVGAATCEGPVGDVAGTVVAMEGLGLVVVLSVA